MGLSFPELKILNNSTSWSGLSTPSTRPSKPSRDNAHLIANSRSVNDSSEAIDDKSDKGFFKLDREIGKSNFIYASKP